MYLVFATVGIVFLLSDIYKNASYKLIFGGAFLFNSIVAFKYPQKFNLMIFAFVFFLVFLSFLIKLILDKEKQEIAKEKTLSDYKGKIATVKKDIGKTLSIDGIGLIEFDNQVWQAKSIIDNEIKANSKVEIISKENMIMNVRAVE